MKLYTSKELSILNVAIELFNKTSFTNVGIDKIIDEAQVSKKTFYKYFPSKMILIEKSLKYASDQAKSSLYALIENEKEYTNKLEKIYEWYENWFCDNNFFGCLLAKSIAEFPEYIKIRDIVLQHKLWFIDFIKDILDEMDLSDSENKAFKIVIILDGATTQHNLFRNDISLKSSIEIINVIIKS